KFKLNHISYLLEKQSPVISIGMPFKASEFQGRKDLTTKIELEAKNLVKIHPTNIYASAYLKDPYDIDNSIHQIIQELSPHLEKFTHPFSVKKTKENS